MTEQNGSNRPWSMVFPIDGDMLSERDGTVRGELLYITVQVAAPRDSELHINGVKAVPHGDDSGGLRVHAAEIALDGYRNTIAIEDRRAGIRESCEVYWLKRAANKYRLSTDDNIWFLRDIADNAHTYRSIFDNPYLACTKTSTTLTGRRCISIFITGRTISICRGCRTSTRRNGGRTRIGFA